MLEHDVLEEHVGVGDGRAQKVGGERTCVLGRYGGVAQVPALGSDAAGSTALGRRLAERTGMPLVTDVGYPTPGSFGSWGAENGVPVVTYEFPLAATEVLMRDHVPVLVELLAGTLP